MLSSDHCFQIPLPVHLIYFTVFNSINVTCMDEKYKPWSFQQLAFLSFVVTYGSRLQVFQDNAFNHHQSTLYLRSGATLMPLDKADNCNFVHFNIHN
jgi:hypothetical protein